MKLAKITIAAEPASYFYTGKPYAPPGSRTKLDEDRLGSLTVTE